MTEAPERALLHHIAERIRSRLNLSTSLHNDIYEALLACETELTVEFGCLSIPAHRKAVAEARQGGLDAGASKQVILELQGRDRFMAELQPWIEVEKRKAVAKAWKKTIAIVGGFIEECRKGIKEHTAANNDEEVRARIGYRDAACAIVGRLEAAAKE